MSLSARIVLRPSRRLAVCESLVVSGGLVVAAFPLVARWPDAGWVVATGVALLAVLAATVRRPRRGGTVVVSDRPEVGWMAPGDAVADGSSWRLAECTMVWPAFCVVAIASAGGERRTLAVLDRELSAHDRRALHRFLLWSLRGGAGRRADA